MLFPFYHNKYVMFIYGIEELKHFFLNEVKKEERERWGREGRKKRGKEGRREGEKGKERERDYDMFKEE